MDPVKKLAGAIASAVLDAEDCMTPTERARVIAHARDFCTHVVAAMQPHYRLGLRVTAAACLALAYATSGTGIQNMSAERRIKIVERWANGPIPGIRECARLLLTLTLLAVFDSNEGLAALRIDMPRIRSLERYYAGMTALI